MMLAESPPEKNPILSLSPAPLHSLRILRTPTTAVVAVMVAAAVAATAATSSMATPKRNGAKER